MLQPINKKPFWASATTVKEKTVLTDKDLRRLRRLNPELLKSGNGKTWLYNLSEFPEGLFKKETV